MITQQDLDRLASLRSEEGIVSASIRIDPRLAYDRHQPEAKFKGAYQRFMRTADDAAKQAAGREHDRILDFLHDWEQRGRGLVIFACAPAGVWEVHELEVDVPTTLSVGPTPDMTTLARVIDEYPRMAVVMLDGGDARIYTGEQGTDRARAQLDEDLPNRHDQGGWSQARYQRHVEFHQQMHLREVAERLESVFKGSRFERLVLVGVETATKEFEALLPDPVRQRVAGRLTANFKQENDDSILERARQLVEEDERSAEVALVEEVIGFAEQGGKGALGLDNTIRALIEGQVDTLVVVEGLSQEGSLCLNCDYFSAQKFKQCPVCSSSDCEDVPDVVEQAMETAYRTGSHVNIVFGGAEEMLQSKGGIGALLRYVPAAAR